MEKKLKQMFDYQAFSGNKEIDRMMKEAETRYGSALSDDDLFFVNAAGTDILRSRTFTPKVPTAS